ncbi:MULTISPECIES: TetR/AcrR family transcriptional regulator [unclassified Mesorhizobium]|uniref:TetR/AcrR family transcriptional regulator n=1 Tax=unclassified Mesorhizobium TaxID=325217 RepID=UPI001125D9D9|nr:MULTISPECIES: TetR/AcrR family transcriptional regulator [unclassified Mesorhizobium]MBZ9739767.1 TetR/AcrR family transcriptional regulator [Mesorhizobium sp. CO1-1-4]MBZ9804969.1 TetR/AcrR family transcriptional regulator [Mesorhizobium sp. ES1-6]TPL88711.1 TetR/AcrR family transcriptional regulator [Mesorhizobium sp. B2-3-12]
MPRPKLHSDEAVLEGARKVLKERGPEAFTLNDVATAVGISRAALIQRFTNRQTLLRHIMAHSVELTRSHLNDMPVDVGPQALWRFLIDLVGVMGSGDDFASNVLLAWYESQDTELRRLAVERHDLTIAAIAARAPLDGATAPNDVAQMIHSAIGGASMQWLLRRTGALDAFILAQLHPLMGLLFPGIHFQQPD